MVLDTSALLAILLNEPERRSFTEAIELAESRWLSAANFVEVSIILEQRHGADGVRAFDRLIAAAAITIVEVDLDLELTTVPEGHTHDGKKHEGLEVHFRRIHQSVDAQDYVGDHCYRDPPGAAFVNVADELVVAA